MESDCESVDSGLEESGVSNPSYGEEGEEAGGEGQESIYENAAVLKQSTAYLTPVTAAVEKEARRAIEKYQFGQERELEQVQEEQEEEQDEQEDEQEEEQEQGLVVVFPPLDLGRERSEGREGTLWGVRQGGLGLSSPALRSSNPTEDKIAKEIRELKEREEELVRRRESKSPSPALSLPSPTPAIIEELEEEEQKQKPASDKFNPSLYRPLVAPPRPRIMEDFISNRGRVTAFSPKDDTKELVQLRKPTVHKSVPKVSAPTALARQPQGSVLDKIQAELAETRRREEELRRSRKALSRSQPDLRKVLPTGPERSFSHCPDSEEEAELEEEEPSSMLAARGKSALISVWESRIQSEQTA